jgi:hypothetical protein
MRQETQRAGAMVLETNVRGRKRFQINISLTILCPIHSITAGIEITMPKFQARPSAHRFEFCVLVEWPDSSRARIDHFGALEDAQRWIERESENWIRLWAASSLDVAE